jgi:hypothetical protein
MIRKDIWIEPKSKKNRGAMMRKRNARKGEGWQGKAKGKIREHQTSDMEGVVAAS